MAYRLTLTDELNTAAAEAKRFLERYQTLRQTLAAGEPGTHPAQTAAVKRASLDLTRALAAMRRRGLTQYIETREK
jgi:hypothetical protein